MQVIGQAQKVTIYLSETDKWGHKSLYMAILERLKAEDCAGATVTRALAGFGAHSRIHTAKLVDLSADLPLRLEWIDQPARIRRVLPQVQQMVTEGLIIVEEVEVLFYSHRRLAEVPATTPVGDIMSREVHTVSPDTPLIQAVEMLVDKVYRTLPVVDETNRVVGILTEGNLLATVSRLAASVRRQLSEAELATALLQLRQSGQTVAEVMTVQPVTVAVETTIPRAVKLMIEHNIKHLPVVERDKLVGIVSRVDILRALAHPLVAEAMLAGPAAVSPSEVGQVMTPNVPTVQAESSLAEVVALLVTSAQRRVVVVNDQRQVVGLISDGDLMKRATTPERTGLIETFSRGLASDRRADFRLTERTAAEVMTQPVITVTPETSLLAALRLLMEHRVKRLPVVNAQGQLVGLVGRGGVLRALAGEG
jgi:CBS domain-containing protein